MTAVRLERPQPKQMEFMRARARYIGYGGARGGGKSMAVRIKASALCLTRAGIRILILRRTFPELRENFINIMRPKLRGLAQYKETEKTLTFANGSVIRFGYCDSERDADQYQGLEYDVIFIDEATHFTEYQFRVLGACVRGVNDFPKRMYLTCNPGGVGHAWVKRLFIDRDYRQDEDPGDYVFIQAKVEDNPALVKANPGYVKFLDNLPEGLREAWRDGNWDVYVGQFFPEWNREIHVCEPFEVPGWWRVYITLDYGMDMLAAYAIAVSGEGAAYVINEVYEGRDLGGGHDGLVISAAAARLKKMADGLDVHGWLAPPDMFSARQETGRSAADIFAEHGIYLTKTSNDRVAGWLAVREWLKVTKGTAGGRTAKLKIFRGCVNLIRTIPLLMYDPKRPSDAAAKPHEITHAPDALRGFCVYWTRPPDAKRPAGGARWTADMREDYNRADAAGRERLIGMWGRPN